jgi:hypothetical protein
MFRMTSNITIINTTKGVKTTFRNIKPSAVKWNVSVSNFTDTCTISLPLMPYLSNTIENRTIFSGRAEVGNTVFHEGDFVDVELGYDYNNINVFRGFIKRINYALPLVLECEGYSYQLKDIIFNKSYKTATVKQVLNDLIKGTDIKLSEYIPAITLKNLTFKNTSAKNVLEWFQKECLCAVSFDRETLFVGASKYSIPKPTERLRVRWNTAADKELKKDDSDTKITIKLVEKSSAGSVKTTKAAISKYDNIKEVKVRAGLPGKFLKDVANELQKLENYRGYKGNVTAFLTPYFDKGYVCEIIDKKFSDRNGKYFVETVEGSFDKSGGRQKLTLIYYGRS